MKVIDKNGKEYILTPVEQEEKKLPDSLDIFDSDNALDDEYVELIYSTEIRTFSKLIVIRDVYRDGWIPDWSDDEDKYCLCYGDNALRLSRYARSAELLSFQTKELAELFLKNFREDIEFCKMLLGA